MHDYLRVKEVAELLAVSEQTVRHLIKMNELKGIRVGKRSIRVDRKSIDEFKSRKEV